MGIFNEFDKKEKPVFTGLKFGFGSGGGAAGPSGPGVTASGGLTAVGTSKKFHVFLQPSGPNQNFVVSGGQLTNVEILMLAGGGGGGGGDGADNHSGGGGGAGGMVVTNALTLPSQTYVCNEYRS